MSCFSKNLFIVFLGPDGCGKSSVISEIISSINPLFHNITQMHLRPKIGHKAKKCDVVLEPHNAPSRGVIFSTAKLFYFLFDYWAWFLLNIKPLLMRPSLIIFDRYYYDLLIDPKRYRYGGSMWFANLISKFVPKPNIVILLDAPVSVLQSRKQEVPFAETKKQRNAYLQYIKSIENGVVIDASEPLPNVIHNVEKIIMGIS